MKDFFIHKGLFSTKVYDNAYGKKFPYKKVKFHAYVSQDPDYMDFDIELNGQKTPKLTVKEGEFDVYGGQAEFKLAGEDRLMSVNFKTGIISPAFTRITGEICADKKGKIFSLDFDGNVTYSEYFQSNEALDHKRRLAEVVDKNGKHGVIDQKLKTVIPFNYDKGFEFEVLDNIKPNLIVAKNGKQMDFYMDGTKILSSRAKGKQDITQYEDNVFSLYEDDKTRAIYILEDGVAKKQGTVNEDIMGTLKLEDKTMVVTENGIWEMGKEVKKVYDDKCLAFAKTKDGKSVVITDEKGKKGVYSLNQEKILTTSKYDEFDKKLSNCNRGRFLMAKEVDGEMLWGIVNEEGEEILPVEYLRPNINNENNREIKNHYDYEVILKRNDGSKDTYLLNTTDGEYFRRKPTAEEVENRIRSSQYARSSGSHSDSDYRAAIKSSNTAFGISMGVGIVFGPTAGLVTSILLDDGREL